MIIPCNDVDERLEGDPQMGLLGHRQCSTSLLLLELKMHHPGV
jgi:hypothetical protein